MYLRCMYQLVLALSVLVYLTACTKYTNELPVLSIPKERLVVPALSNGLNIADFIFEKIKTPDSDTVILSIRNNQTTNISGLKYVVELCQRFPHSFDNCDQQLTATLPVTIKPDSIQRNLYKWVNKNIKLDSTLINVGIISYEGSGGNILANSYSSIYSIFETDTIEGSSIYYAQTRGYILTDGLAIFRIKTIGTQNFTAKGLFVQSKGFTGQISRIETDPITLSTFQLDSIKVNGEQVLIDTSQPQNIGFRMRLNQPIDDTIRTVSFLLQKN